MINMSYVQFENTFAALQECENTLMNKNLDELSERERDYAIWLIETCGDIAESYEDCLDYDDFE